MSESRSTRKRISWLRLQGVMVGWIALLLWGLCYRMPYDLQISVFLWSTCSAAAAGLAFGLWKGGSAVLSARTWKGRWRPITFALVLGFGMVLLVGIPVFGLLVGCNGTFRSTEPFVVDGTVISKRMNSGRSSYYWVVVQQEEPRRAIRLDLKRDTYQRTQIGDHYHEEFQLGLFGWPCRPQ